jgi:hypothetical protein
LHTARTQADADFGAYSSAEWQVRRMVADGQQSLLEPPSVPGTHALRLTGALGRPGSSSSSGLPGPASAPGPPALPDAPATPEAAPPAQRLPSSALGSPRSRTSAGTRRSSASRLGHPRSGRVVRLPLRAATLAPPERWRIEALVEQVQSDLPADVRAAAAAAARAARDAHVSAHAAEHAARAARVGDAGRKARRVRPTRAAYGRHGAAECDGSRPASAVLRLAAAAAPQGPATATALALARAAGGAAAGPPPHGAQGGAGADAGGGARRASAAVPYGGAWAGAHGQGGRAAGAVSPGRRGSALLQAPRVGAAAAQEEEEDGAAQPGDIWEPHGARGNGDAPVAFSRLRALRAEGAQRGQVAPSARPRVWIDPAKTQHRRDFFTTVAEAGIQHRMRKLRTKASGKVVEVHEQIQAAIRVHGREDSTAANAEGWCAPL